MKKMKLRHLNAIKGLRITYVNGKVKEKDFYNKVLIKRFNNKLINNSIKNKILVKIQVLLHLLKLSNLLLLRLRRNHILHALLGLWLKL